MVVSLNQLKPCCYQGLPSWQCHHSSPWFEWGAPHERPHPTHSIPFPQELQH
jgi:hypothetical protein